MALKPKPIANSLKELSLFADLSAEVLQELANKLTLIRLEAGEILFHEGEPGDSLYIIESGLVKAFAENGRGEEVLLNQFGAGESFGEMSLVDGEPRSASIGALAPTQLWRLGQEDFLEVLSHQPTFALEMLRDVSAKLRFAASMIQKVSEWSEYIAQGDYSLAMKQIKSAESEVEPSSDEARARAFLASISQMVERVQGREQLLQEQVHHLRIKIDEDRREHDLAQITESEYFQKLQKRAHELRRRSDQQK